MGDIADTVRTPHRGTAFLWHYVRSAPWTFSWLTLLLMTTVVQHLLPSADLRHLLGERSTNLRHLESDPIHVLVTSLLWIDGAFWLPYLLLFCIFHAPAERWLGSLRWAAAGLSAHIGATYLSQGVLALAIRHGYADSGMIDVRDIGVSYFLAGIVGILTYHVARPWRWLYLGASLVWFAVPLATDPTFTALGHFSALSIGLAAYPLTRARTAPQWNPAVEWQRRRARAR
ncbi:rhomboid-like protein [Nocardia sp. NPDC001965]